MFIKTLAIALLYTLLVPFSLAQNNSVDSQEIAIEETHELTHAPTYEKAQNNNYIVSVHGIVCELCSYGVAKKIRKLSFIDTSQANNGVKVDVENQRIFITLLDNMPLDKAALFKAIESGGYKPIDVIAGSQEEEQE